MEKQITFFLLLFSLSLPGKVRGCASESFVIENSSRYTIELGLHKDDVSKNFTKIKSNDYGIVEAGDATTVSIDNISGVALMLRIARIPVCVYHGPVTETSTTSINPGLKKFFDIDRLATLSILGSLAQLKPRPPPCLE